MLTRETTVIYRLLGELADTCEQLGLSFFLAPRLSLHAYLGLGMPSDPTAGQILMRAEDMEALRVYLKDHLPKDRALESMMDGGSFPGLFLRYEDLNTLYVNPNQGTDYRNPCMNVEIYPIRRGLYRTLGFRLLVLEKCWRSTCYSPCGLPSRKVRTLAIPFRIVNWFNRPAVARYIYKRLLASALWGDGKRVNCFLLMRDKHLKLPAEVFQTTAFYPLEEDGRLFPVAGGTEQFLTAIYGEGFQRKTDRYAPNPKVLLSASVPAQDYLACVGGLKRLQTYGRRRKKIYWTNRKIGQYRRALDAGWTKVKGLAYERKLELSYAENKDVILRRYNEMDYARLERNFAAYNARVEKVIRRGKLPAVDEEIFPIYLDTLIHTGDFATLGKVSRLMQKTGYLQGVESEEDEDLET